MKKLFLKMFRDVRKSLGLFVAISAVSAIGVALLTGFSVTSVSMQHMTNSYYKQANLADLTAYYLKIDDAGIAKYKISAVWRMFTAALRSKPPRRIINLII